MLVELGVVGSGGAESVVIGGLVMGEGDGLTGGKVAAGESVSVMDADRAKRGKKTTWVGGRGDYGRRRRHGGR